MDIIMTTYYLPYLQTNIDKNENFEFSKNNLKQSVGHTWELISFVLLK
jgi:hypothetical protein